LVEEEFKNFTGSFIASRIDRLLAHAPTLNSLRGRDENGASDTGLALNAQGEGSSIKGDFAFSSSGFQKLLRKQLNISPVADPVLPFSPNDSVGFEFWAEGQFSYYDKDLERDCSSILNQECAVALVSAAIIAAY
jgi:hypothetical protein